MAETSKTADQALRVLEAIAEGRGATVAALVRTVGLSRTAVHRAVATLVERGYADRRDDGVYVVGPAVRRLQRAVDEGFTASAQAIVERLAREHGETCFVTVASGTTGQAIAQGRGERHHLRVEYPLGQRHPLHRGASGRAILAFLDPADAEPAIRDADDPDALRHQLDAVRRQGYADSHGEIHPGIAGLSVPVVAAEGAVASLTAVVPAQRLAVLPALLPALLSAAAELSGLSGDSRRPAAASLSR